MSRNVPVLHENMLFGPAMASDEDDTVWQNAHIYTDTHRVFVDGDLMREKHFHARDCDWRVERWRHRMACTICTRTPPLLDKFRA